MNSVDVVKKSLEVWFTFSCSARTQKSKNVSQSQSQRRQCCKQNWMEECYQTINMSTNQSNPSRQGNTDIKRTVVVVVVILLKAQTSKLYNNKYTIASTQITNTKILAFIAVPVLVFKLLTRKNRKVVL